MLASHWVRYDEKVGRATDLGDPKQVSDKR